MGTQFLTKDQIVKKNAKLNEITPIEVEEWGGQVGLKVMSQAERETFDRALMDNMDEAGKSVDVAAMKAVLVAGTICDGEGKRIFTSDEIREMPTGPIERLYAICQEMNGMTEKKLEEAVKN